MKLTRVSLIDLILLTVVVVLLFLSKHGLIPHFISVFFSVFTALYFLTYRLFVFYTSTTGRNRWLWIALSFIISYILLVSVVGLYAPYKPVKLTAMGMSIGYMLIYYFLFDFSKRISRRLYGMNLMLLILALVSILIVFGS